MNFNNLWDPLPSDLRRKLEQEYDYHHEQLRQIQLRLEEVRSPEEQ